MPADAHFDPHRHAWAQLAYCATGILQVTAGEDIGSGDVTFIVPPSRAVWIAPGALHSVHVLEEAHFRTLYIDASVTPPGWSAAASWWCRRCCASWYRRSTRRPAAQRANRCSPLVLDELRAADTQALGVPLPPAHTGDKRLRALCEAVLRAPAQRATLAQWAADVGASERTMARLFRDSWAPATSSGGSRRCWRTHCPCWRAACRSAM